MKKIILLGFLISLFIGGRTQNPLEMIYIHTDRDVYAPADEINFQTYIRTGNGTVTASSKLSILLTDPAGHVAAGGEYPVAGNLCPGTLALPDSLKEGEYRLLGYTGEMEKGPVRNAFTRKLYIRKNGFPDLFITLKADSPWYVQGDQAQISVRIMMQNNKPFNGGQFLYLATKNSIPYQNGIGMTDANGDATLLVRIPSTENEGLIALAVDAEYQKLKGSATILLPGGGVPVFLNFFPEGGVLIDGLESRVGFRAQDFQGIPMEIEGLLLDQDNQPVDTIKSSGSGIGSFRLVPNRTDPLKVKITKPAGILKAVALPAIRSNGVQLTLKNRTAGYAGFLVRTNRLHAAQHLTAIAEADGKEVSRIPLVLDDTLTIRIPVNSIKNGTMRVSLTDQDGRILAQRALFFYQPAQRINVVPGKGKNKGSDNVNLSITDDNGKPIEASLSISRFDAIISPAFSTGPDIRSWFLLGPVASALPSGYFSDPNGVEPNLMDNLMLTMVDTTLMDRQTGTGKNFRESLLRLYQPGQFEQLVMQFHKDQFFNEHFIAAGSDLPGFIHSNTGDLQDMGLIPGPPSQRERIRQQLETGMPVLSVIRSIKPYTLSDNQLYFSKGKNSLEFPKGALFLVDGIEKGYNIEILNSYSPLDISDIMITEKISDILKYTGDAGALILIETKGGKGTMSENPKPSKPYNPTLYWNPGFKTSGAGAVPLVMPRPELRTTTRMVIRGVDINGNYVETVI